jgi:small subunit ribosomal protein S4
MRNLRKKFKRPKKSWNLELIAELKSVKSAYGLRATKEILLVRETLRGFRGRARQLIAVENESEKKLLLGKLAKMGLIKADAGLDDVLAMTINNILERRLQTLVFRRGMSTSIKHARQLITHGRVSVNGIRIKFPSYIVTSEEEPLIGWYRGEPKRSEGPKKVHKKTKQDSDETQESVQVPAEVAQEPVEEPAQEIVEESK